MSGNSNHLQLDHWIHRFTTKGGCSRQKNILLDVSHTSATSDQRKSTDMANLPYRLIVDNIKSEKVNGIKLLGVIWDHKISSHSTKKQSKIQKICFSLWSLL